ncbi:MAG: hypothetical protein Q9217_000061 [Psora testacea]
MAPVTLHLFVTVTPTTVRKLLEKGFVVNVERSPIRIFEDKEFEDVGANLVPTSSWRDAPRDHIIIGLKELPTGDFNLIHTHIQFAHCYKGQEGWETVLGRFAKGGGTLYDLEFLENPPGRRVAAFGYHAGFVGSALAIMNFAWQLKNGGKTPMPGKHFYDNERDLIKEVQAELEMGIAKNHGKLPRVLVVGALGRSGKGSLDLCRIVGIPDENLLKWDLPETKKGGPFVEIRESDLLEFSNPPLSYIAIDHLPSLLPREASENFSDALLPSLFALENKSTSPIWLNAEKLFKEKVKELEKSGAM